MWRCLFLIALLAGSTANASVAFVQAKSASASTVTSLATGNFGANVSAANMLVIFTSNTTTTRTLSSCTDTLGNTFHVDVGPITQGSSVVAYMAHAYNITGGKDSVTCTWSGSGNIAVSAAEYSGERTSSDPLDVTASGIGNSASWSCGTTPTSHFSNELIAGGGGWAGSGTVLAGTNFTLRSQSTNSTVGAWQEDGTAVATGAQNATASIASARNYACITATFAQNPNGLVNVVTDCGAKGDGVTNDGPAIQSCINANPGRHILFPKMCGSQSGGGSLSCVDYVSQQQITLSGNGQWLEGEAAETWQGAPVIQFTSPTAGGLAIPQNGYGEKISNLELNGPLWSSNECSGSNGVTWPQTYTYDGINIQGGEPTLENVIAEGFGRHGVNIDGSQGGQPDLFRLVFVGTYGNLGDGLYIHGGDSNAGVNDHFTAVNNCGWGVRDDSGLGDTHIQPHTNGNHREAFSAGATVSISSVSRSSNVVTVTTATAHGLSLGQWAILAGVTDTSYNGTFPIVSVGSSTTFAFNQVGANSSSSSGTVGSDGAAHIHSNASKTFQKCSITSGANVLACADGDFDDENGIGATISVAGAGAAGATLTTTISATQNGGTGNATLAANASTTVSNVWATVGGGWGGGPYNGNPGAPSIWINPYQESNQPTSAFTSSNLILGGNFPTNRNFSYGEPLQLQAGAADEVNPANGSFFLNRRTDHPVTLQLQAGVTTDQDTDIVFDDHTGANKWQLYRGAAGYFAVKDLVSGISPFDAFDNAQTELTAQGTGTLNLQENSTGNIQLYGPLGASHSWFTSSGNLVQGNVNAPALTVNTSGADYAVLYNGNSANSLSVGFTATSTASPASAVFTVPLTGNASFANGVAAPRFGSGSSSNTDVAGQLTLTAGNASYSFAGIYSSAPICTANDTNSVNAVQVATTTTTLTLTGTSGDVANYMCFFRN